MQVLLMGIVMLLFYFEVANVLVASILISLQVLTYALLHIGFLEEVSEGNTLFLAYSLALSVISILTGSLAPLIVAITGVVLKWHFLQKFKN